MKGKNYYQNLNTGPLKKDFNKSTIRVKVLTWIPHKISKYIQAGSEYPIIGATKLLNCPVTGIHLVTMTWQQGRKLALQNTNSKNVALNKQNTSTANIWILATSTWCWICLNTRHLSNQYSNGWTVWTLDIIVWISNICPFSVRILNKVSKSGPQGPVFKWKYSIYNPVISLKVQTSD